ncbi:MAG: DNA-damage-inducible protein J [Candidatus Ruthia sp. Asou_11_S2]|nr:DNA-damage-inducible protein J [Candidatus Ruthia sp. Asou_11_S2]
MTTLLSTRIDNDTKIKFVQTCEQIGLNPSQAIKLFAMAVINSGSIPFKLTAKQPNQETIKAMQELENGNGVKVNGVKALFKELDAEM